MPQTPLTSATSYATNDQMIDRYDVRTLGDLLSDTDTSLSSSEVSNSTRLTTLLKQASGEVEAACVAGRRYVPEDLQAMLDDDGVGADLLIGLVCDIAMWRIMNRRPSPVATDPPGPAKSALQALEQLRGGERIFPFDQSADAGKTVEKVGIEHGCNIVTAASRYFGFPLCGGCCGGGNTTSGCC